MKSFHWLKWLAVGLVLVIGAVGCQRKPKGPTPIPGMSGVRGAGGPYGTEPGGTIQDTGLYAATTEGSVPLPLDDGSGMRRDETFFSAQTVYFDFDRSTIKSGERPKAEFVASHLKSNPTNKVRVEGHCDERGTEGYNLALGERRALSVREYLINLGISPERIYTTSFGEAMPADPGRTEAAYALNRRAEFILLLP